MDEASSPNETSKEFERASARGQSFASLRGAGAAVKISTCEHATFGSDSESSDAGRKVEIRINLGFDDQTPQKLSVLSKQRANRTTDR